MRHHFIRTGLAMAFLAGLTGSPSAQIVPVAPPGGTPAPAPGGGIPGGVVPGGPGGITPGQPPVPVNPAGPDQHALDDAFKDFLVGRWAVTFIDKMGWQETSDVWYREDGTLIGRETFTNIASSKIDLTGRWKLTALDKSNFSLTLILDQGTAPSTDTLTYIDQNTLYSSNLQTNVTRIQ